jgi:hypothetical protein
LPPRAEAPAALSSPRDDRRLPPAWRQARDLLARPQTAGTAFVLREIFDRPLCKRRRSV